MLFSRVWRPVAVSAVSSVAAAAAIVAVVSLLLIDRPKDTQKSLYLVRRMIKELLLLKNLNQVIMQLVAMLNLKD